MSKRTGSCLCKKITFQSSGDPICFSLCHCSMCRKMGGSPFGAFIGVYKKDFQFLSGENEIGEFDSSEWAKRTFCKNCGSSLMYIHKELDDRVFVSAGLYDSDPGIKPVKHIFVKDKCSWYPISDELEQVQKF